MKYIKALNSETKFQEISKDSNILYICTIKNNYYLFPYFIGDNCNGVISLNPEFPSWEDYFIFVSKEEYMFEIGIQENELDIINELLASKNKDNQLIAVEIYKQIKNKNNGTKFNTRFS